MWIDTHAHLDDARFAGDLAAVLRRAREAGVGCVITCGCDLPSSRRAVELARRYGAPGPRMAAVRAAVGVHPHEAARAGDLEGLVDELRELAGRPGVVAIGEIGLDYHYRFSPAATQQRVLARQLRLARELGLPVVLHTREAVDDVLRLLETWEVRRGVLHAFAGTAAQARRALALGFYLGVGGLVTFKNADEVRRVAREAPLDRLLVETDAPYLAPAPYRGRRNEPGWVAHVGEALARLRGHPLEELKAVTCANARRLFGPGLDGCLAATDGAS